MALNIKDPETVRLAAEVAALTGETKTRRGPHRPSRSDVTRLRARRDGGGARSSVSTRFLEREVWPLPPGGRQGKADLQG